MMGFKAFHSAQATIAGMLVLSFILNALRQTLYLESF
jgi:hypothetical protein